MDQISQDEAQHKNEIHDGRSVSRGHEEELVDHYWGSMAHVTALIRSSEIKAGLILSFYGILFNFIYQNSQLILVHAKTQTFINILIVFWLVVTLTSIFFSIRCFMPRIEGKFEKNVFFFGDVITKFGDIKEFSKTFYQVSLNQEELFLQLGQQIYIISKIAALKFKFVNRSILLLTVGLILLVAIGLSVFILDFFDT
ncbi:Pycsar system effector family protein [Pareuzebyella sediminis]|uniref:Pycsar system effector family protein n=1 Tax=Pareuzebyella sediminis TaxID=2607998 RepID=UPI001E54C3C8|nr:Pycsar system effector family protein [Pareuzebyella sediminis]